MSEELPSGRQTVLSNRVGWALLGMERAGLVERVRCAVYRLTDEGGRLLARGLERVDDNVLATYPAFAEWKMRERQPRIDPAHESDGSKETPEETLTRAADEMRAMLEVELLDRVRRAAPAVLEQVAVEPTNPRTCRIVSSLLLNGMQDSTSNSRHPSWGSRPQVRVLGATPAVKTPYNSH